MKFSCDSCHAQYMIADEKVGPAGVKVRCKKCSNVIHVKRAEEPAAAPAEAPPAEESTVVMSGEKLAQIRSQLGVKGAGAAPKAGGDEIGQAFDSMFSAGGGEGGVGAPLGGEEDGDELATRVLEPGEAQRAAGGDAGAEDTLDQTAPSRAAATIEWFLAINDEQVGPLTTDGIKERCQRGEVGPDTLAWSAGLPDWKAVSAVPELAVLLAPPPPPKARNGAGPSLPPRSRTRAPAPAEREDSLGGFKPAAASALASLASLAQEEIEATADSRPAAKPAKPAEPSRSGISRPPPSGDDLFSDVPEPSMVTTVPSAPLSLAPASSFGAQAADPDEIEAPPDRAQPSGGGGSMLKTVGITVGVTVVLLCAVGALGWFFYLKPRKLAAERSAAAAAAAKKAPAAPTAHPTGATVPTAATVPGGAAAAKPATPHAETEEDRKRAEAKRHGPAGHAGAAEAPAPTPSAPATPAAATPTPPAAGGGNADDFLGGTGTTGIGKELSKDLDRGGAGLPESLLPSEVMSVVRAHKPDFVKCKSAHPGVSGKIILNWRIQPDGRVTDVNRSGGDLDNPSLERCMKAQIGKLHFGQYRGEPMAPIDFPFDL